jgi:soluble lytic murein transglycosylase
MLYDAKNIKQYGEFESYEEWNIYFSTIKLLELEKYLIKQRDGYTEYTLIDTYGNYYIFQETSPMQYTVVLDTYTIDIPEFVEKYSNEYGINDELVYAVIKCESNFDKNACSRADAAGLMQLTKETFDDIRKMLNESSEYTYEKYCFDAEINIKFGTKYLQYLMEFFNGDKTAAIAAYNAGMGNVKKWLGNNERLDQKDIGFNETAEYVNRILKAEKIYKKLS